MKLGKDAHVPANRPAGNPISARSVITVRTIRDRTRITWTGSTAGTRAQGKAALDRTPDRRTR